MRCPGQPAEYSEEDIPVLTDLEHVRQHPGMYIGSTDSRGLHYLLFGITTESLAEAVAGHGREVRVTFRTDGFVEVADDGRGPPNVEQAFAVLDGHRGYCPYPDGRDYFGYPVANALSERLRVLVRSDGSVYQHAFTRGVTSAVVESAGPPGDRGLTVAFKPDPEIFGAAQLDADAIRDRLRQLAYLHSGVRITFADEASGTRDAFEYADGIREYVALLNEGRSPLHADVIVLRGEEQGVRYEVGLQWCEDADEVRHSFANHYRTTNGGSHDRGLAAGAALGLRDFTRAHQPLRGEFISDDFRDALTAVVSVWLREPYFESATRSRLGNPEVEGVVTAAVRRGVREYFEANRGAAERVVKAVVAVRDAREAARPERRKKR
jgi:DNA gyrase subunit B